MRLQVYHSTIVNYECTRHPFDLSHNFEHCRVSCRGGLGKKIVALSRNSKFQNLVSIRPIVKEFLSFKYSKISKEMYGISSEFVREMVKKRTNSQHTVHFFENSSTFESYYVTPSLLNGLTSNFGTSNPSYPLSLIRQITRDKSHCVCPLREKIEAYLQCFSTLLLNAIFSPISVQTG